MIVTVIFVTTTQHQIHQDITQILMASALLALYLGGSGVVLLLQK
jgi:hypothetical protein